MFVLLDIVPPFGGGAVGTAIAMSVFFIFAAVAFFVYRILKRSVKMAIRMIIAALILLIGVVGSLALLTIGGGGRGPVRPPIKITNSR